MAWLVNGERIAPAGIDEEFERLKPHYDEYVRANGPDGESSDEQLREWARENLIERTVVLQAARRMDVEIPQEEIDAAYEEVRDRAGDVPAEEVKADIELQMRVDRLMEKGVPDVPEPTEEELQEFYEAHKEQLVTPEQVHASHIVKNVNAYTDRKTAYEAILDVRMQLVGGASFEELAVRHSDCPENAGDLGTFGRGRMVQEFEDVIFAMKPGEVSDVFPTQFGYHIAKLHEHIESRTIPLEEVRDAIAEEVLKQKRAEAVEAFVDSLKAEAVIEEVADE